MITAPEIDDRIGKCERILSEDPNSQIFAALADAYRKKGEMDKAFRICKKGLKSHAGYGSAHLVMAKINLDRRLYDWAEVEVDKAASIDGTTRAIELLKAEIYIYKGEFNQAIKLLKKLHDIDPGNEQIKRLLDIAQKIPEEQTLILSKSASVPVVESNVVETNSEFVVVETNIGSVPSTPDPELSPSEIIEKAIGMAGVDGALFINREGLVVDSKWALQIDPGTCGATMTDVMNSVGQDLVQGSFGKIRSILIEAKDILFYQVAREQGTYLFVSRNLGNLGSIRMKIDSLVCKDGEV